MSLIEKEPIMKFIEDGLNNKHYGHVGVEIITEVEFAPIIEAEQVVHCMVCRHFKRKVKDVGFCVCGEVTGGRPMMRVGKDFCSYGMRMKGESNG